MVLVWSALAISRFSISFCSSRISCRAILMSLHSNGFSREARLQEKEKEICYGRIRGRKFFPRPSHVRFLGSRLDTRAAFLLLLTKKWVEPIRVLVRRKAFACMHVEQLARMFILGSMPRQSQAESNALPPPKKRGNTEGERITVPCQWLSPQLSLAGAETGYGGGGAREGGQKRYYNHTKFPTNTTLKSPYTEYAPLIHICLIKLLGTRIKKSSLSFTPRLTGLIISPGPHVASGPRLRGITHIRTDSGRNI